MSRLIPLKEIESLVEVQTVHIGALQLLDNRPSFNLARSIAWQTLENLTSQYRKRTNDSKTERMFERVNNRIKLEQANVKTETPTRDA